MEKEIRNKILDVFLGNSKIITVEHSDHPSETELMVSTQNKLCIRFFEQLTIVCRANDYWYNISYSRSVGYLPDGILIEFIKLKKEKDDNSN